MVGMVGVDRQESEAALQRAELPGRTNLKAQSFEFASANQQPLPAASRELHRPGDRGG